MEKVSFIWGQLRAIRTNKDLTGPNRNHQDHMGLSRITWDYLGQKGTGQDHMRKIRTIHIKSGLKECKGPIRKKQDQLEPLYLIGSILDFLRPKSIANFDHKGPNRTEQDKSGLCGTKQDHEQPYRMILNHMVPF